MEKKLLLFVFIVVICCSSKNNYKAFKEEDDRILWSSKRKLTWDDFKGAVPDTTEPFVSAISACSIKLQYENIDSLMINYKIENYFVKSKSWTISDDVKLLAHEQLHFDISELYARKIRKSFDSLRVKKNNNLGAYLEIYKSNLSKC